MIKVKLFFLVLFLCVFQLSFTSALHAEVVVYFMGDNIEKQLQTENPYITQDMSVELSKKQLNAMSSLHAAKYFLSNNAKDFYFLIVQGNLLFNSVKPRQSFNNCLSQRVVNVPIYLQTEKFRL